MDQTRDYFNEIAEDYDSSADGKFVQRMYGEVVRQIMDARPEALLDLGCGNGNVLLAVGRQCPARLYGLDLSENMIAEAEKRLAGLDREAGGPAAVRPVEAGGPAAVRPGEAGGPAAVRPVEAGGPGAVQSVEAGGPSAVRSVEACGPGAVRSVEACGPSAARPGEAGGSSAARPEEPAATPTTHRSQPAALQMPPDSPRINLQVGDAASLPYENGIFDTVACNASFHHYPDPEQVLKEIRRVLRPGGALILGDPTAPFFLRPFLNLSFSARRSGDHHLYGKSEIIRLLRAQGFSVKKWKVIDFQAFILTAERI